MQQILSNYHFCMSLATSDSGKARCSSVIRPLHANVIEIEGLKEFRPYMLAAATRVVREQVRLWPGSPRSVDFYVLH